MSHCFPAGWLNAGDVDGAVSNYVGDDGFKSLKARNEIGCGTVASRKENAFTGKLAGELVYQGGSGSALSGVSDSKTRALSSFGRGLANSGDARSNGEIAREPTARCEAFLNGSDSILTGEDNPVESREVGSGGVERS